MKFMPPSRVILLLWAIAPLLLSAFSPGDNASVLRTGHWVRIKGAPGSDGRWTASSIELKQPEKYEVLTGTVSQDNAKWDAFVLLGVPVTVSSKVASKGLPASSPAGLRIKVEGYFRGARKFSARGIRTRRQGRESMEGRIDEIEPVDGGFVVLVMNMTVFVPESLMVVHELPLAKFPLIQRRGNLSPEHTIQVGAIDEDDEIPESIELTESLFLGGQIEWTSKLEDEFNLDESKQKDRVDHGISARIRLRWVPDSNFQAVATLRYFDKWRRDDDKGRSKFGDGRLSETYLWWNDILGANISLIAGRQDFDDPREWVYDQNLDAVRLIWSKPRLRTEISISTTLSDGGDRNKDTTNLIAYVSNNDSRRHLAGWIVDRQDSSGSDDSPIHFGARALGKWFPANNSWAEISVVKGFRDKIDYDGYGWDIGTTWSPDWLGPLDVTAGWAFGQGDDPGTTGDDESFIQTGFQDNNGRFGGVTSFRYYGELLDPELSNLSVFTLGVGARVAKRTSLDLVWHMFRQDVAAPSLRDSGLRKSPSGLDRDIGTELDLILGMRRWKNWDLELVAAWYRPGDAFPGSDNAFLGKFQVRYKF